MQLKPLNQDDFTITIIKDLGMKPSRGSSNRSIRFAIFKCSDCASEFEAIVSQVKATRQTQCKSCSQKTHGLSKSNLYPTIIQLMEVTGLQYVKNGEILLSLLLNGPQRMGIKNIQSQIKIQDQPSQEYLLLYTPLVHVDLSLQKKIIFIENNLCVRIQLDIKV